MNVSEIKPEELRKKLVAKHKNLLKESKKQLKDFRRVTVLEEKVDQLSHWVAEQDEPDKKLVESRGKAADELAEIRSRLTDHSPKRVTELEEKIRGHEEALKFWTDDERAGTQEKG